MFAPAFALIGLRVAAHGNCPQPTAGWILVGMVSARLEAMASNRSADATLAADSPRFRMRLIPAGCASVGVCAGLCTDPVCGLRAVSFFANACLPGRPTALRWLVCVSMAGASLEPESGLGGATNG